LCEGTDCTGVSAAFEFDFNTGVANDLGCPLPVVVNGCGKSPKEVLDAAVDAEAAQTKLPQSEVAGRATVFIFPDLNTGNNL
jgi:hypothetical protein